jgi:hypothetical protein
MHIDAAGKTQENQWKQEGNAHWTFILQLRIGLCMIRPVRWPARAAFVAGSGPVITTEWSAAALSRYH